MNEPTGNITLVAMDDLETSTCFLRRMLVLFRTRGRCSKYVQKHQGCSLHQSDSAAILVPEFLRVNCAGGSANVDHLTHRLIMLVLFLLEEGNRAVCMKAPHQDMQQEEAARSFDGYGEHNLKIGIGIWPVF